ncbi:cobalt-zinc-cadmium resistance protein [Bacteroides pyogenes JCM 10003]|nr:cobalt-zinc-cadmium resistance protein [Bacteroides pyogenes JCM 10003]
METEKQVREREIYKATIVGSVVNLLLLVFKFTAGIVGHSAAMIADAVHSLSDFVTDVIVIVFVRISNKPQDKGHDYGHGKYETMATVIIGLLLLAVGFGLLWTAASSIYAFFVKGESPGEPGMVASLRRLYPSFLKKACIGTPCAWAERSTRRR